ncbi:complex 1 protein-domain-containing protein [Geopyxis carbonaria]|nr:complex 1 protein-domain-containing protein [Geopyxis carbonaria]
MVKLTGIQRDVISLYRACLRTIRLKPLEAQYNFRIFVREEFRKNSHVAKRDFMAIEHLLRVGNKKLEAYSQPSVKNLHR